MGSRRWRVGFGRSRAIHRGGRFEVQGKALALQGKQLAIAGIACGTGALGRCLTAGSRVLSAESDVLTTGSRALFGVGVSIDVAHELLQGKSVPRAVLHATVDAAFVGGFAFGFAAACAPETVFVASPVCGTAGAVAGGRTAQRFNKILDEYTGGESVDRPLFLGRNCRRVHGARCRTDSPCLVGPCRTPSSTAGLVAVRRYAMARISLLSDVDGTIRGSLPAVGTRVLSRRLPGVVCVPHIQCRLHCPRRVDSADRLPRSTCHANPADIPKIT